MAKDKKGKSEGKKAKLAEKKQKQEKKGAKKEKAKASKADDSDAEDIDLDAVLAEYAKKQVRWPLEALFSFQLYSGEAHISQSSWDILSSHINCCVRGTDTEIMV